jgi:hypothetical protein
VVVGTGQARRLWKYTFYFWRTRRQGNNGGAGLHKLGWPMLVVVAAELIRVVPQQQIKEAMVEMGQASSISGTKFTFVLVEVGAVFFKCLEPMLVLEEQVAVGMAVLVLLGLLEPLEL